MKLIGLLLILGYQTLVHTQEPIEKPNFEYHWPAFIDLPPVYPGCANLKTQRALTKCFNKNLSLLISENFDQNIAKSLHLNSSKDIIKIETSFNINTSGNIMGIKVKAPHRKLKKEAKRVLKLIPQMTEPAKQKNKACLVTYQLPILFRISQ